MPCSCPTPLRKLPWCLDRLFWTLLRPFQVEIEVSNTFDAHRVLTAAYQQGGPEAQDKAAEALFHSYFAKEKAPNDPGELRAAAEAAGLPEAVLSKGYMAKETKEELEVGRKLRVRGVPHFVIRTEGARCGGAVELGNLCRCSVRNARVGRRRTS